MYRVSFHLVSIVLGLALAANLPNVQPPSNSTPAPRPSRRNRVLGGIGVVCRDFPGLSKEQFSICLRSPLEAAVALQGLKLAVAECQYQFRWDRWNCSSLRSAKNRNPHSVPLLKKGYKESAFAYALSSAGVMHAVSRACGLGLLPDCGCGEVQIIDDRELQDEKGTPGAAYELNPEENETSPEEKLNRQARSNWKWSGCPANLRYGMKFSELFLDSRETRSTDLQSEINLHNNRAGREAVLLNAPHICKCHGMSGSCGLRTCWRSAPEFRRVGDTLKEQFSTAILVKQGNLGRNGARDELEKAEETDNSVHEIVPETFPLRADLENNGRKTHRGRIRRYYLWKSSQKKPKITDLLYFQKSPTFCEKSTDYPGTTGRRCRTHSKGYDGCTSMCCDRGYDLIRVIKTEKCSCRFEWCCQVMCKNCTVDEWVTVCK